MDRVVVLSFGAGNFISGFPAVTAQLWDQIAPHPIKFTASLPAVPSIPELYRKWQLLYLSLHQRLDLCFRIEIEAADVTNVSEREFSELCLQLSNAINHWLNDSAFCKVVQQLRTHLDTDDEIRFIFESDDHLLQRLPWHLWHFFDDYRYAEVALSAPNYQRSHPNIRPPQSSKARILAILGNSQGINIAEDRAYLEQFSNDAEITFLVEPTREHLNQQLWKPWHVLFFAGHSFSQDTGILQLNPTDTLTLEQLRYALRYAIAQGLKLAIFNSCDGLGLARSLADLHIPQVVVMREPVPDPVAQRFLQYFLTAFAGGYSLYQSVREARERLQGLEDTYPCATWLPVIFQNPAEEPPRWHDWFTSKDNPATVQPLEVKPSSWLKAHLAHLRALVLIAFAMMLIVMGVRYVGFLQRWELHSFDQLMRSRPGEPPDERLLIVAVTENDFQLPEQQQRTGSLSDEALAKLLDVLHPLQPRAIGLDIYRDFPSQSSPGDPAAQMQANDDFFAVCKARDRTTQNPGIAPPPEVPLNRQGFSDIIKDSDDVLRRHLLAMNPDPTSPCQTPYALSSQLAFHYLNAEGISIQYTSEDQLQIGDVLFKQLKPHQGAYHTVDPWGYQILLNYRIHQSITEIAPTVTLAEVLSGQLSLEDVQNRIILIGVTARSTGDYLSTPFSSGLQSYEEVPGVVAQAQMASQILSAVQDGRPLLQPLPMWADGLWIWGWAVIVGLAILYGRSPTRLIKSPLLMMTMISATAVGTIYLACLVLLTQGYWMPFIPTVLAFMLTGSAIATLPSRSSSFRSFGSHR